MQDTKKHLGSSFCTDFHCDNTTEEDGRFLRTFCQDKIFAFVNNTKRKTKGFFATSQDIITRKPRKETTIHPDMVYTSVIPQDGLDAIIIILSFAWF